MKNGTSGPPAGSEDLTADAQIRIEIEHNSWQFQFLRLTGFRNFGENELEFRSRIIAIAGPNGTGKTNLLEALYLLCTARGFAADREIVHHSMPFFLVEGKLQINGSTNEVSCGYWPGRGKKLIYNRRPLPRLSDHLGQLPVVAVLPDDTSVVRSGAKARRLWLDSLLVQFDRRYLEALLRYERALQQRNALLQAAATTRTLDLALLELYDSQMAEAGAQLITTRQNLIEGFTPVFRKWHGRIVQLRETPTLTYIPSWPEATNLIEGLRRSRNADLRAGRTLCGPHRDELLFELNNQPVRKFGSQGQVKSWIIALRLAQYDWFAQQTSRLPLLLLDDLFDKLDEQRMRAIGYLLREEITGQIFVSDPSASRLERVWQEAGLCEVQWIHSENFLIR